MCVTQCTTVRHFQVLRVAQKSAIGVVNSATRRARAISLLIGVDGLLRGVYRHNKVFADVSPGWDDRGLALRLDRRECVWFRVENVGDVRDSIPAVPGSAAEHERVSLG
jgi:hypothetical protein